MATPQCEDRRQAPWAPRGLSVFPKASVKNKLLGFLWLSFPHVPTTEITSAPSRELQVT